MDLCDAVDKLLNPANITRSITDDPLTELQQNPSYNTILYGILPGTITFFHPKTLQTLFLKFTKIVITFVLFRNNFLLQQLLLFFKVQNDTTTFIFLTTNFLNISLFKYLSLYFLQ